MEILLEPTSNKLMVDPQGFEDSHKDGHGEIVRSCDGLLLCYIHGEYSIYNPLMSMFNMLPPIHNLNNVRYGYKVINFAFDPTKSPCYKVVHVGSVKDDHEIDYFRRIQTYSSETGVWSVSDDRFNHLWFNDFGNGIYWNGAIHWLNIHEPFHVKLDIVDHLVLKNIQIPLPLTVKGQVHRDHKLSKSHVSLLLLCKDYDCSRHLKISGMKNEYSVWSVKYSVNLDDMMRPYPTWRMPTKWCCRDMLSIVLGERDEDSFMSGFGLNRRQNLGLDSGFNGGFECCSSGSDGDGGEESEGSNGSNLATVSKKEESGSSGEGGTEKPVSVLSKVRFFDLNFVRM
ncbi:hypothetical protein Tco_0531096 [Tanacetum coccineum]